MSWRICNRFVYVPQEVANARNVRKDAVKARTKGHVAVRTAEEVAHERYMRAMGC